MVEYRHSAHAVFDIKYHVVWITRYRYKIPRGRVAERARDLVRQICQAREVVIVRGAVSPDHMRMLLSAPPHMAPSKLVQYIKGRSSRRLQEEFPELRKRYWGQPLWARGYFCATVGAVDEQTIPESISRTSGGMKTIKDSRSPRSASLKPAVSRERFRRLQLQVRLSVVKESTGFSRWSFKLNCAAS